MENVEHLDTENANISEVLCENETLNGATIGVIGFQSQQYNYQSNTNLTRAMIKIK